MNPINAAIERLLAARELSKKEFPLAALLSLYLTAPTTLYLNHFEGFKLLVKWLGPVEKSKLQPITIPKAFSTYECQEIGTILGEHPSVIYQELYKLWTLGY